jgi:hypothetical protein
MNRFPINQNLNVLKFSAFNPVNTANALSQSIKYGMRVFLVAPFNRKLIVIFHITIAAISQYFFFSLISSKATTIQGFVLFLRGIPDRTGFSTFSLSVPFQLSNSFNAERNKGLQEQLWFLIDNVTYKFYLLSHGLRRYITQIYSKSPFNSTTGLRSESGGALVSRIKTTNIFNLSKGPIVTATAASKKLGRPGSTESIRPPAQPLEPRIHSRDIRSRITATPAWSSSTSAPKSISTSVSASASAITSTPTSSSNQSKPSSPLPVSVSVAMPSELGPSQLLRGMDPRKAAKEVFATLVKAVSERM